MLLYAVFPSDTVIVVRLVHPANGLVEIKKASRGMLIEIRLVHDMNARVPIDFTLLGMVIDIRFMHDSNAQ